MSTKKHPPPVHLRPKVDTNRGVDKKLAQSQDYLAAQATADPQNALAAEASTLATARKDLTIKLGAKSQAQAALDQAQANLVISVDAHDVAMKEYAGRAAKLANGDASFLSALGVQAATQSPKHAHDNVAAPAQLVITPGANPGEAIVKCQKVPHAASYVFEYKLEPSPPADPWLPQGGMLTKYAMATITGLSPNQAIRVRARAIGGVPGPWSDEQLGNAR